LECHQKLKELKTNSPMRNTELIRTKNYLVALYTSWGKADEAAKWKKEVEHDPK
jgi:hypothetical protein